MPTVSIIPVSPSVCIGGSINLTASGAGSYTWSATGGGSISGGSNTATVTVTSAGTYTVTGTTSGCSSSTSVVVTASSVITPTILGGGSVCSNGTSVTLTAGSGFTTYSWSASGGGSISGASNTQSINATSSGTYTVTVTQGSCSGTGSTTLTINPIPTASITVLETSSATPDGSVCIGENITLIASGGVSYSWNNGSANSNIPDTPTSPSENYTVTVTGIGGCTATATRTVNVNALPTVSISPASPALCIGSNLTLTAIGGTSYAWSTNGGNIVSGGSTATPTIDAAGSYSVTGTTNGCSSTANVLATAAMPPDAGTAQLSLSACNNDTPPINLFDILTAEQSGGVWSVASGNPVGTTFNASNGTFTPNGNAVGTFTFTYTVTGAASCPGTDSEEVTVILTSEVSAGVAPASQSVCANSTNAVSLADLLTSETTGGTWTVVSSSPASGTFNAANGTFMPNGNTVGTFTFTYTVTGGAGCPGTDSKTVTIELEDQLASGSATDTLVCPTSTSAINLFSLLKDQLSGGIWSVAPTSPTPINFNPSVALFIPSDNNEETYLFNYAKEDTCGGGIDTTTVQVVLSSSVCGCPTPNIILKSGSDTDPKVPILLCKTPGFSSSELSYKWRAYTLVDTLQTLITDNIGDTTKSYYVRDICLEREWLELPNCEADDSTKKIVYKVITTKSGTQCADSTSLVVDLLKSHFNESMYQLSPNPTADNITLLLQNEWQGMVHFSLADLTGRRVYEGEYDKQNYSFSLDLSLATLPQGIYIAQIAWGNGILHTQKITKF